MHRALIRFSRALSAPAWTGLGRPGWPRWTGRTDRAGRRIDQTVDAHPFHRFEGQVGIDGVGPVADEQAEVHDLSRLAGFHDNGRAGPQPFPNEIVMHGGGGDQARDLDPVRSDFPVRQDEQRRAPFTDGPARLAAELVHGFLEGAGRVGPVGSRRLICSRDPGRPPEHGR